MFDRRRRLARLIAGALAVIVASGLIVLAIRTQTGPAELAAFGALLLMFGVFWFLGRALGKPFAEIAREREDQATRKTFE